MPVSRLAGNFVTENQGGWFFRTFGGAKKYGKIIPLLPNHKRGMASLIILRTSELLYFPIISISSEAQMNGPTPLASLSRIGSLM